MPPLSLILDAPGRETGCDNSDGVGRVKEGALVWPVAVALVIALLVRTEEGVMAETMVILR